MRKQKAMERKRDGLVSIGEIFRGPDDGPRKKNLHPSPQGANHFTRFDQVDQLVGASEADPDMGFMARLMTLCRLPRTNPGDRKEYVRRNGPYTLGMSAGINNKLPYGNIPRLLLAWVCTEAVRTQSRELVLGTRLRSSCASWASTAPAERNTPGSAIRCSGSFIAKWS